jgi:hypothetical protein
MATTVFDVATEFTRRSDQPYIQAVLDYHHTH